MRIVVLRAKGGVGGSALCLSLSKYFAMKGKRVLLVDRDAISTASSMFGLSGLGLIQLVKNEESYERAIARVDVGRGSITVLKVFSDGVPVEYEREDLLKYREKLSTIYGRILREGNFDLVIVDTMPATTPLEPIVGWEYSTYMSYSEDKTSKYILVSEPSRTSIEASVRYYRVLKKDRHLERGVEAAVLNKVDLASMSESEHLSLILNFMDSVESEVGVIVPIYPAYDLLNESLEKVGIPTQIMELGSYLIGRLKKRKIIVPSPTDPLKRSVLLDISALVKCDQNGAESTMRAIANYLKDSYPSSKMFLLTSLSTPPFAGIAVFRSLFSFSTERVKVKSLDEGVRLAKRIGGEIVNELSKEKLEKKVVIFYPSEDIEPVSDCCDRGVLSKLFWNELISHIMQNSPSTSLLIFCDPGRTSCYPIEDSVDMVIEARLGGEGTTSYRIDYSRIP